MKSLIEELNRAREAYYNTGETIMSDEEFDIKLETLRKMEEESGIVYSNSPTSKVGAKVLTELNEVEHNHPMLSLAKCHSAEEVVKFAKRKELIYMDKLDGLSISLLYEDGELISADTRGDGSVGSDVTEHVKQFTNVPTHIKKSGRYVIDGEAIIKYDDFNLINVDGKFKNPRNTASGALSLLDVSIVKDRRISFVVWDVIEGSEYPTISEKLTEAEELGFEVTPFGIIDKITKEESEKSFQLMYEYAEERNYPIDGVVYKFNDVEYGASLGKTEHHFNLGIARKKENKENETILREIKWQISKTGLINPVAVFDPVDLDGAITTRATLHNISYIKKLELGIGDTITIIRANEVIPKVLDNLTRSNNFKIPTECPCCGGETKIVCDKESENLICTNEKCRGKFLGKLVHFCGKQGLNIEGLNESTLEFLANEIGISSYLDFVNLHKFSEKWKTYPGFGPKSVNKILLALENAVNTRLDKFICALSIPNIGKVASKQISNMCFGSFDEWISVMDDSPYRFTSIDGFGKVAADSLAYWWKDNRNMVIELGSKMTFSSDKPVENKNLLRGKNFVITGKLVKFKNRNELVEKIETLGGKVMGAVSKNVSYLINNDVNSSSSKNQKARELGIPVISEQDFIDMCSK